MKKPKKATPTYYVIEEKVWTVVCPHCKTKLVGGFGEDTLMLKCFHCGNPIDLREKEVK